MAVVPRGPDVPAPAVKPGQTRRLLNIKGQRQAPLTQPPHHRTGEQSVHDPVEARRRMVENYAARTLSDSQGGRRAPHGKK